MHPVLNIIVVDIEKNPEVAEDLFSYLRIATISITFAFYSVGFLITPVVILLDSGSSFPMSYRLGLVALTFVNFVSLAIRLYL